jgi:predicted lipid-binding transport protein (Tim44 family)
MNPNSQQPTNNDTPPQETSFNPVPDTQPVAQNVVTTPEQPATVEAGTPASVSTPSSPNVAPSTAAAPENNQQKRLAIISLVLGIVGFLTGFLGIGILLGIAAIIVGIIALVKKHDDKTKAIIGIVLGSITVILGPIAFTIFAINIFISSWPTSGTEQQYQQRLDDQQIQSDFKIE